MKNSRPKGFKRRIEGKTNYELRLRLVKSRKPRLVVRKSLNHIRVQVSDYNTTGDKTLASAFSKELKKFGWNYSCSSIPAAYLTGLLCGKRAVKAGATGAVFDIGLNEPINGSKTFAVLKGALDSGMKIPHGEEALPAVDKLSGAHIAAYAALLKKENKAMYEKLFSKYLKEKQDPEAITKVFEQVKTKIGSEK